MSLCTRFSRNVLQSDRRVMIGGIQRPMSELAFPITTIDPIDELLDILIQVTCADAVKCAQQEAFPLGVNDVHRGQPCRLRHASTWAGWVNFRLKSTREMADSFAAQNHYQAHLMVENELVPNN